MARYLRYDNLGGSGDRTASVGIPSTLSVASGTLNNLIDGGYTARLIGQMIDVKITQALPHSLRGEVLLREPA